MSEGMSWRVWVCDPAKKENFLALGEYFLLTGCPLMGDPSAPMKCFLHLRDIVTTHEWVWVLSLSICVIPYMTVNIYHKMNFVLKHRKTFINRQCGNNDKAILLIKSIILKS